MRRSARSKSPTPAARSSSRAKSPGPTARSSSKGRDAASKKDAANSSKSPAVMAVAAVMALYMAMSVSTTLMNKLSFPKDKFPFPFAVTCFQMIVAIVWLLLLTFLQSYAMKGSQASLSLVRVFGVNEKVPLRWSSQDILSSAGAAFAFTGMLAAGNMCLLFVQISFYQAAKSQHILCNLVMGYVFFGNSQPLKIILCCLGVTVGFVINTLAERDVLEKMASSPDFITELIKGCVAGLISSVFVALYPILLNNSFLKGSDTWQKSININCMSLVWYLPLIGFEILTGDLLASPALWDPHFWAFNFATGTVGFLLNVVAMLHVRYTSPLTHMIVGSLKGAVTTFITVIFLGDQINAQGVTGLSLLVASSFAYSYIRSQKPPMPPK